MVSGGEEFPSSRIVWESLKPFGVELRPVALRGVAEPEAALLAATDTRTELLAISSVQHASGLRLDLARLGAGCRARGIGFCVDAIQGLGVFAHEVTAMHIGFLMADGHKWLLGPEGLAVFYCAPNWRERLTLHQYGWHMVEDASNCDRRDWQVAASARRLECGSPNTLGIHALDARLSLLEEIRIEVIERRVLERAQHLVDAVCARTDLELLTAPGRLAGIATFRHRRIPNDALFARLRENDVVCAVRGGGIRFSPHFHTPLEHLDQAVAIAVS